MHPLLSSQQMKAVDGKAIEELGLPETLLMEHAALAVVDRLEKRFGSLLPKTKGVLLVGPGNNGGDALAAARILFERGTTNLFVILVGPKSDDLSALSASCTFQLKLLGKLLIPWGTTLTPDLLKACDWIVDGIFGTGLSRDVTGRAKEVISLVNEFSGKKHILAVDIPSGLCADKGKVLGVAVQASETVTLGFYKRGLVTAEAADCVGKLSLATIQIPRVLPFQLDTFWYTKEDAQRLPYRRPAGHKGDFGHVWISIGEETMEGAALLSALGALKAGAGLVSLVGEKALLEKARQRLALEVMTRELDSSFLEGKEKGVWVLGPGLGKSAGELLKKALKSPWTLVLDADALNALASAKDAKALLAKRKAVTVLTPHPKEAARLLGISVEDVESDRYEAVIALAESFHSTVLLKGKGTLIRSPQGPTIVLTQGDNGLSKGGTGDLLAGVIGSLLAQGLLTDQAVPLAVYLHGRASELLTQKRGHSRSSLASEIADQVSQVYQELGNGKAD